MSEKHKKDVNSHEVVDASGKVHVKLDLFLRGFTQRLMGVALDNGRLSINTDRQFDQFNKTIKDAFYEMSENAVKYLKVRGVMPDDPKSDESQEVDK